MSEDIQIESISHTITQHFSVRVRTTGGHYSFGLPNLNAIRQFKKFCAEKRKSSKQSGYGFYEKCLEEFKKENDIQSSEVLSHSGGVVL